MSKPGRIDISISLEARLAQAEKLLDQAEKALDYLVDQDWMVEKGDIKLPINMACAVLQDIQAYRKGKA